MPGPHKFCIFRKLKGLEDWALQQWRDFYIGEDFVPTQRMNRLVQNVQGRGKKTYAAKRVAAFYKQLIGRLDVSDPSSFSRVDILSNSMLEFVSALSDQPRVEAEVAFRLVHFTRKAAAAMAPHVQETNAASIIDNILENLNCLALFLEHNPALQVKIAKRIPNISGPYSPAVVALQREYKRLRSKGRFNMQCLDGREVYIDRLARVLGPVMLQRQPETREYQFSGEPELGNGVKILFRRSGKVTIQGKKGAMNVYTHTDGRPVPLLRSAPPFAKALQRLEVAV